MTKLEKEYSEMVDKLTKDPNDINMANIDKDLTHMALGIAGEAGEIVDAIKKFVIYGKFLDMKNVIEELGDMEFYMEHLRQILCLSREEILDANMQKLLKSDNARYKNGYSDEAAQERADKQ